MKKGFGILEVLIAAVVLGFLIIGLNKLQLGNREVLLRVRERDAASFIAQHVLDSLGAVGINSIQVNSSCGGTNLVFCKEKYIYKYEGNSGNIKTEMNYNVKVELLSGSEKETADRTKLTDAEPTLSVSNIYAKSLKATVSWKHKGSDQSIQVAKVVR